MVNSLADCPWVDSFCFLRDTLTKEALVIFGGFLRTRPNVKRLLIWGTTWFVDQLLEPLTANRVAALEDLMLFESIGTMEKFCALLERSHMTLRTLHLGSTFVELSIGKTRHVTDYCVRCTQLSTLCVNVRSEQLYMVVGRILLHESLARLDLRFRQPRHERTTSV